MTKNTGARKTRPKNLAPSFDLLVRLVNQTVSSEEISFVFTHWGKVRDVHRPYEDRDYRFVRYERQEDMRAALRGYHDGSLRYLQPEWLQCNVYESPSNSLFEVIVRDVPAEISDREWSDCILKYGAVRAVHRIPDVHHGVCDMFVAMEDLKSHNIIKALLATLAKYHATLSDIFYGKFVPPASFCASVETAIIKSASTGFPSLRDHRNRYLSVPTGALPPMPVCSAQVAMCRRISAERSATHHFRNVNLSPSPTPDPSMFRFVRVLARKSPQRKAAVVSSGETTRDMPSQTETLKKDPSDIWFSCGEETADATVEAVAPCLPQLKPDCTLLTDAKPMCISPVDTVSLVLEDIFSSDDDFSTVPEEAEELQERTSTAPCQRPRLNISPATRNELNMSLSRDSGKDNRRKKRRSVCSDIRSELSQPPPLPQNSLPQKNILPFPPVNSKMNREAWILRNKQRRRGSDPVSLKQYAAMVQSGRIDPPGYFHKFRQTPPFVDLRPNTPVDCARLKTVGDNRLGTKTASVSLMGVPFPCDQSPLRMHYDTAKKEGRVVTLRFSETKLRATLSSAAVLMEDTSLTEQEQIDENCLIAKWRRAYYIYQSRRVEKRLLLRSPVPVVGKSPVIPVKHAGTVITARAPVVSYSGATRAPTVLTRHATVRWMPVGERSLLEKCRPANLVNRRNGPLWGVGPQDARSQLLYGPFCKSPSDYYPLTFLPH